jgi:[protein-PII] uridylyltransferase
MLSPEPRKPRAFPTRQEIPSDKVGVRTPGMPPSYYLRHGDEEIQAHASIISRRAGALVHLERCTGPSQGEGSQWMCVVADDRPGLLSLLSAAISAHSLDILSARAYCRARPGMVDEAIDLFAVRAVREPFVVDLDHGPLSRIRRTLEDLLRGRIDIGSLSKQAAQTSRPASSPAAVVYFDDARGGDLLIVEAEDRPGLLLAITLTIFREGLTITRSHVTTFADIARDEFDLAEPNGSRLSLDRKRDIAEKVWSAVAQEPASR